MNDIKNIEPSQTTATGMGYTHCCAPVPSVVYNEDCLEGLKRFSDNYFDLAIVDPPYGIGADKAQNAAAAQREKANGKSKAGRGWKAYKETDWDNETPSAEYWRELRRVSKNQIVWGGNYFTDYLEPKMGWIVWCKSRNGQSIVCENTKADWLPFKPMTEMQGAMFKTTEAIWSNHKTNYDAVQQTLQF